MVSGRRAPGCLLPRGYTILVNYQRVKAQFADNALLGRACTPDQIAGTVGWLLDADCMMTGQLVVVDAGFTLGRPPAAAGAR